MYQGAYCYYYATNLNFTFFIEITLRMCLEISILFAANLEVDRSVSRHTTSLRLNWNQIPTHTQVQASAFWSNATLEKSQEESLQAACNPKEQKSNVQTQGRVDWTSSDYEWGNHIFE